MGASVNDHPKPFSYPCSSRGIPISEKSEGLRDEIIKYQNSTLSIKISNGLTRKVASTTIGQSYAALY
jgi:hypothetical protein